MVLFIIVIIVLYILGKKLWNYFTEGYEPINSTQPQFYPYNETITNTTPISMTDPGNTVTPYNVDIADPKAYSFVPEVKVVMPDPQALQADPVRGDIPIKMFPEIPLIQKSSLMNKTSLRTDGAFSSELYHFPPPNYFETPMYSTAESLVIAP